MDIRVQLLGTANVVRNLLQSNGPKTLAQLEEQLKIKSELLSFALGWMAREDKIEISLENKTFRVQLKS